MRIAITDIETEEIVSYYEAEAPNQAAQYGPWGDPTQYEHVEYPLTVEELKEQLIAAIKAEGFKRVYFDNHCPPYYQRRIGLLPPGHADVQAASALIEATKAAVDTAESALVAMTTIAELGAFEMTWQE
ncbi:hypothetical protein LCGC14_0746830 [marine sediment metagenome]|uniref:Uncharacterized protein n=1 Tax=marine sediment metagenome TaxID=412755 RepID=A0A0F9QPZ2_9ZZZZ